MTLVKVKSVITNIESSATNTSGDLKSGVIKEVLQVLKFDVFFEVRKNSSSPFMKNCLTLSSFLNNNFHLNFSKSLLISL